MKSRCTGAGWVPVLAALFLAGTACDLLQEKDKTAPTCRITSPGDSALVNGTVTILASAEDAGSGVSKVEFYVDGTKLGDDSSSPYGYDWDAGALTAGSRHTLFCVADDQTGNRGYSDTIDVEVTAPGQRSVFHGQIDLSGGYYAPFGFQAETGETLAGDMLVTAGGSLSSFFWFDKANYHAFASGGSATALYRQDNTSSFSMREGVPATDSFYIVFLNAASGTKTIWARLAVE